MIYEKDQVIFICDNSPRVNDGLASLFKDLQLDNLRVYQTSSGKELMSKVSEVVDSGKYPSVIVTDFLLSDCNAIQVCSEIRKNYPPFPISVIGIGQGAVEEVTALYRSGVNAYFCKPSTLEEYIPIVHSIAQVWLYGVQPAWKEPQPINDDRRFYQRRRSRK